MVCGVVSAQSQTYQVIDSKKMNLMVYTHTLETHVLAHGSFLEEKQSFSNKIMHLAIPQKLRKYGSLITVSHCLIGYCNQWYERYKSFMECNGEVSFYVND